MIDSVLLPCLNDFFLGLHKLNEIGVGKWPLLVLFDNEHQSLSRHPRSL